MKWDNIKLGQIATVSSGDGAPQEESCFDTSGVPFIRAGSLSRLLGGETESELEHIRNEEVQARKMEIYPKGTVVFAKSGMSCTKGYVYQLKQPCCVVNHLATLVCGDRAKPLFIRRWFEKNSPARLIANSAYPSIKISDIRAEEIPLPPLEEQKRIAGILDAADALRAKRRESLAKLDDLLQSTFLDMFGDPVTNPKGLEVVMLKDAIKVKSGNGLVAKEMAIDGEYPVYGGNGINGYHDSFMFEEPKIVLGRVGVYCGCVHLTQPFSWVTDNALYVEKLHIPIDLTYLVYSLGAANLNQYAGQAAQPLISGNRIYPVEILLPPLDLQQRFAEIVSSVEEQKAKMRKHLEQLDDLFASLQQRAFRGDF